MIVVEVKEKRPHMLVLHMCCSRFGGIITPSKEAEALIFDAISANKSCEIAKRRSLDYHTYLSSQRFSTDAMQIVCILYNGMLAEFWGVAKYNYSSPLLLYSELVPKEFIFSWFFSEEKRRRCIIKLISKRYDKRLARRLSLVARAKICLLCRNRFKNSSGTTTIQPWLHALETFLTHYETTR